MAMRRQEIIKKLEDDGVLTMNRELVFPVLPQRIAVISSKNAAGYTDFIKHLTENSFGYSFYTALIETAMQGNETEPGIISALEKIAANLRLFDVVVIIRGGGSQTDLSWFDNYNIAYYITQFPLPVITGIGHEKDLSVTDIVAFQSLKTPTAVADYLIDCMNKTETLVNEMSSDIIEKSRIIMENNSHRLETGKMKLIPVARIMISEIKEQLSGLIIEMVNIGKETILRYGLYPENHKSRLNSAIKALIAATETGLNQRKQNLKGLSSGLLKRNTVNLAGLENSLTILNPENVLKRGYTITSVNGMIVKKSNQIKKDDLIDTQFSDGSVRSKVVEKEG